MKRIITLLVSVCVCSTFASAQDVIKKNDGSELKVIVLTADHSGVSYKNIGDPLGTVHFIPENEGYQIQYGRTLKPNMKYKELRPLYDTRDYVHYESAAYKPGIMGIASFLIPGFGDCLVDEWGRGLLQFGGTIVCTAGASILSKGYHFDEGAFVCAAGGLAIWIWSIFDAVKVSKIKNMYIHDYMKMYGADFKLYPSVSCLTTTGKTIPTAGLTLALTF